MAFFEATPSAALPVPVTVRDNTGALAPCPDLRYQLRDAANAIVRAFPGSGTDFLTLAAGAFVMDLVVPAAAGWYLIEYQGTVNSVLQAGEPDVLLVRAAVATASAQATLQAAVTALGSPAQASVLTAVQNAITALGTPSQAAALAAVATAITNLGSPAQAGALAIVLADILALGFPLQSADTRLPSTVIATKIDVLNDEFVGVVS